MWCLKLKEPAAPPPIFDLEKAILGVAWQHFLEDEVDGCVGCGGVKEKFLRKNMIMQIDWSCIKKEDRVINIEYDKTKVHPMKKVCLFETTFRNNKKDKQKFAFNVQRQTQSSLELSVTEGFTVGGHFDLKFSLGGPKIGIEEGLGSAGFGGNFSWTGSKGERLTKGETLSWNVNNELELEGNSASHVELCINEADLDVTVTLETVIKATASNEKIPIDVKDKKTGDVMTILEITCEDIVKRSKIPALMWDENNYAQFKINSTAMLRGSCGVGQVVSVKECPLDGPISTNVYSPSSAALGTTSADGRQLSPSNASGGGPARGATNSEKQPLLAKP